MKKPFKKKWVEALRSGEFKQARGKLRKRNGAMCCLGVACELLYPGAWEWDKNYKCYRQTTISRDEGLVTDELPSKFLDKIGLTPEEQEQLIDLNDGCKDFSDDSWIRRPKSFSEIADFIEASL